MTEAFTTPSQLMAAAKRLRIPLNWVGAKDEFNLSTPIGKAGSRKGQGYIINLQDSNDGPGTHWVCVFLDPSKKPAYFDSFGADIPDSISSKLPRSGNREIVRSKKIIQDIEDGYCGQYCLYFIKRMSSISRGGLEEKMRLFERTWYKDPEKNQKMIKDWTRLYLE